MLINFALKEWLLYEKPVQSCWTLHHKVNSMDPFGMREEKKMCIETKLEFKKQAM